MRFLSLIMKHQKSSIIAKHRLKSILIADHADCSSDLLNAIREDLNHTLSKYMTIDRNNLKVDIISDLKNDYTCSKMVLVIRIPFNEINKVIS